MSNFGMPRSSVDSAFARAYALRDRLTDNGRDRILVDYYSRGPGRDRVKAIEAGERWLARGDSSVVMNNLSLLLNQRRDFARAETLFRALVRRRAPSVLLLGTSGKTSSYRASGSSDLPDAMQRLPRVRRAAETRRPRARVTGGWRRGLTVPTSAEPGESARAIFASANLAWSEGRGREAVRLVREAWRIDSSAGRPAPAVFATLAAVGLKLDAGLPYQSELRAFEAQLEKTPLSSLPSVDAPYFDVALWLARAGRPGRAREVLAQYRSAVRDTAGCARIARPRTAWRHKSPGAERRWRMSVPPSRPQIASGRSCARVQRASASTPC
jgi:hypothetical protein